MFKFRRVFAIILAMITLVVSNHNLVVVKAASVTDDFKRQALISEISVLSKELTESTASTMSQQRYAYELFKVMQNATLILVESVFPITNTGDPAPGGMNLSLHATNLEANKVYDTVRAVYNKWITQYNITYPVSDVHAGNRAVDLPARTEHISIIEPAMNGNMHEYVVTVQNASSREQLLCLIFVTMQRVVIPTQQEGVVNLCVDNLTGQMYDAEKLYSIVQTNMEAIYWPYRIFRQIQTYNPGEVFGTTFGSYNLGSNENPSYTYSQDYWIQSWDDIMTPELAYLLTSYDKSIEELASNAPNSEGTVVDTEWLLQTFANVNRKSGALPDNSSSLAWELAPNSDTWTNQTYIQTLAASSVYIPFVSHTGDDAFLAALGSLAGDSNKETILRQYTKAHSLLKPLYYTEDPNKITETINNYLQVLSGSAKRVTVANLLESLSSSGSYSYFTVRGNLEKQKDGSWSFVQPITSTGSTGVTGKVMEEDTGTSLISASGVVVGNPDTVTSTVMTIGNSSGVGSMTTLVLNNCMRSIRNSSVLVDIGEDFLYLNPFGDIVTSDNLVVLPAAANPLYYNVGLSSEYLAGVKADEDEEKSLVSFSPYAGFARNYTDTVKKKLSDTLINSTTKEILDSNRADLLKIINLAQGIDTAKAKSSIEPWISALETATNAKYDPTMSQFMNTSLKQFCYAVAAQFGEVAIADNVYSGLSGFSRTTSWSPFSGSKTLPNNVIDFLNSKDLKPPTDLDFNLAPENLMSEVELNSKISSLLNDYPVSEYNNTDAIYGAYNPYTVAFMNSYPTVPMGSNGSDTLANSADISKHILYYSKGISLLSAMTAALMKKDPVSYPLMKTDYKTDYETDAKTDYRTDYKGLGVFSSAINDFRNGKNAMKNCINTLNNITNMGINDVNKVANITFDGMAYSQELLGDIMTTLQAQTDSTVFGDYVYDYAKQKFIDTSGTGNVSVSKKDAEYFRAFDATRVSAFRLLPPTSATVASDPVVGVPIYPYFINRLDGSVELSTSFSLREENAVQSVAQQVVSLANASGSVNATTVAFDILALGGLTASNVSLFPYNEDEGSSSDYLAAKAIANNMYLYFTSNLENFTRAQNNPNLREQFLFNEVLCESLQGVADAKSFESDVQLQDKLFALENSAVGRKISELALSFESVLGSIRGVLGVPTLDSNALFSTTTNILIDYAPFIFIAVIAIFAMRFSRSPKIYNWMGTGTLALVSCYLFIFIIPQYGPIAFNSVGSIFSEGLVSKSIMFRLEKENTNISTKGVTAAGIFDANSYDEMSASVTLYSLDRKQIEQVGTELQVNTNSFRNGDKVVLDPQSGLYLQGNAIKMNTDVLFKTTVIEGQTLSKKYFLRNVKLNSNVVDYYMPYYLLEDGFVDTLSSYTNFFNAPRRSVAYMDGTQKDSFVVASYMKSFPFLYSNLFVGTGFQSLSYEDQSLARSLLLAEDTKIERLWDSFSNSTDMLNMTRWVEYPTEAMRLTQWYNTMEQNGYYEDVGGERLRQDLVNYVNYQVRRFMFENQDWFDFIADDTLVKCIAMQASFYFNQRVSALDNWIYPTRYNQEDLTVTDAYTALSVADSEYLLRQESSLATTMHQHYGIGGSLVYILLTSMTACFSVLMTFAFPLMYNFSGAVILLRLIVGRNLQRTLGTFVKSIAYLVLIFTAWLISVSLLPNVLSGFILYVVLTIIVGFMFYLTVLVYIAFIKGLLFGHKAFEAESGRGALGFISYAPRMTANWLTSGVVEGIHSEDAAYEAGISGAEVTGANRRRILSAMGDE